MAKRVLLGTFFSMASFLLVQTVMAQIYGLMLQPFEGSLVAGIVYGLIHGTLSVALCQTLLVMTADRQLAGTATRYAVGVYLLIAAIGLIYGLTNGALSPIPPSPWPTIAIIAPWLLAAILARRRLIIEWTPRRKADTAPPPVE